MKILILSVGSVPGQNALDALEGRREQVEVLGTNSDPWSPNNYRCDKVCLVPLGSDEPAFSERLLSIITTESPDLILAGRDQDVFAMASWWEKCPWLRASLSCGGPEPERIIRDKFLSSCFALENGLRFAESAVARPDLDRLVERHGFPLIAKPREGFGSVDVFVVHNVEQMRALEAMGGFVFQEYLAPPKELEGLRAKLALGTPLNFSIPEEGQYSCQTIISPSGDLSDICCTLNRMNSGVSYRAERVYDPDLTGLARGFAQAMAKLGWAGPFNLQCKRLPTGEFVGFEMNGRMTATTSARLHLGFDELGSMARMFVGGGWLNDLTISKPPRQWVTKARTDRCVRDEDAAKLLRIGSWTPSS